LNSLCSGLLTLRLRISNSLPSGSVTFTFMSAKSFGESPSTELQIYEETKAVPDWIKTNAKWWNEEKITDTDFSRGIEYLIKQDIIILPTEMFDE